MLNINNEDTSFLREMKLNFGEEYQEVSATFITLARHSALSGFGYRTIFIVGVTMLGVALTKYSERKLNPVALLLMKVLFFLTYLIGLSFIGNRVLSLESGFAVLVGSVFVFIASLILAQITVMYIDR